MTSSIPRHLAAMSLLGVHAYKRQVFEPIMDRRKHSAPYRGHGSVPLRFGGNVVMRMGIQHNNLAIVIVLCAILTCKTGLINTV